MDFKFWAKDVDQAYIQIHGLILNVYVKTHPILNWIIPNAVR